MPRSIPVPKMAYEQIEEADESLIDAAFDLFLDLFLELECEKNGLTTND